MQTSFYVQGGPSEPSLQSTGKHPESTLTGLEGKQCGFTGDRGKKSLEERPWEVRDELGPKEELRHEKANLF